MMYYSGYSSHCHVIQSCAVQCSPFTVAIMKLNVYIVELTCLFAFLKIICRVVLGLSITYSLTLRWHHFIVLHFSFISGPWVIKMHWNELDFFLLSFNAKNRYTSPTLSCFANLLLFQFRLWSVAITRAFSLRCNSNSKLFKLLQRINNWWGTLADHHHFNYFILK